MAPHKKKSTKKIPAKNAAKKTAAKKAAVKKTLPKKNTSAKLSRKQLEDSRGLAYTLYVENGWEQKLIAETIGISEQSISRWKLEYNWEQAREELRMGPEHEIRRLRRLINAKLDECEKRKAPLNYPDSAESDQISKWGAAIRALRKDQVTMSDKVEVGKQFIGNTQAKFGQDAAKQAVEWWHSYIMTTA